MANPIPGDHMANAKMGSPQYAQTVIIPRFTLESGEVLEEVPVTFTTYGRLNSSKDNCIIVGHSLTSNTNIHEWWDTFMGEHAPSQPIMQSSPQSPQPLDSIPPRDLYKSEGPALDPSLFFVVCINYISSPYGTISPISFKPKKSVEPEKKRRRVESENSPKCSTGETRTEPDIDAREDDSKGKHDQSEDEHDQEWYGADFPLIASIRDNVRLQYEVLTTHLGVKSLFMAVGGSMGGMLALQFGASYPGFVRNMVIIASCARHTDWAIGLGHAERVAIYTDPCWSGGRYTLKDPPNQGLASARSMAMLSYRTPHSITSKFKRKIQTEGSGSGMFAVESYLTYQGEKFISRFDANCYVRLTKTLDTHDIGNENEDYVQILEQMHQPVLVIGVDSDTLYPVELQQEMAAAIPKGYLYIIESPHGHDGFLIEIEQLNMIMREWVITTLLQEYYGEDLKHSIPIYTGESKDTNEDPKSKIVDLPWGVVGQTNSKMTPKKAIQLTKADGDHVRLSTIPDAKWSFGASFF